MVKPKHGEEEEPHGLEITSIGSLYSGPWDKKYWSSSRGKDRYPYPVGYQTVRTFNGSTYKMEIREGSKGPTFLITSADGHSYSGQTPYIAFEKFQKKYAPRIKDLHGKRFACKLDGVEFFGFKNPFIQKLLRELVANVNGNAEQDLLYSAISNYPSRVGDDSCCQDSHSNPNLFPYMPKEQQITRKRSRRCVILDAKKQSEANLKRFRPQDQTYVADASHLIEVSQRNHNPGDLLPSLLREGCAKPQAPLLASVNVISSQEGKSAILDNGLLLTSVHVSNNISKSTDFAEEARMLIDSGKYKSIGADRKLPTDRQHFDRSPKFDGKSKEVNFSNDPEVKKGDAKGPKDSQDINDVDFCVTDTLYSVQDHTSSSGSIQDKSFYRVKEESVARDAIISEGAVTEFHSEEAANVNSNVSSQRSDFDSVGQEMVKSMMTFLLPQAVPLLKKGSRKKKVYVSPIKVLPPRMHSDKENNNNNSLSPAAIVADNKDVKIEQMNYQFKDTSSVVPTKSDTLGNLVANPCDEHLSNNEISPSPNAESCQENVKKNIVSCSSQGQLVDFDEHKESLDCHLETSDSKDIFCCDEVCTNLDNMLQDSDINLSDSLAKCTQEEHCFEKIGNACISMNEISADIVLDSDEMDHEKTSSCIEATGANVLKFRRLMSSSNISPKQNSVMNMAADTGITSTSQVSNLVYSRKRVRTITPMKGNYNGLFSESIICRNCADSCVSEKYPIEGNPIVSETRQISFSDDKSCEKDICGEVRDLSPQGAKSVINPKSLLNNAGFTIPEGEAFTSAVKDKEKLQFSDHFVVQKDISEPHDKNVVHHNSLSSQKHESSSNSSSASITEQVHKSSGMKPQGMDIINEPVSTFKLVGCYLHPIPVLLLLLRTRGNEINICALCGLPDDETRILFIYRVSSIDLTIGHPCFIGHTSVDIPIPNDYSGGQFALEKSGLQLTPDGQCIVLLGSIRTPYCSQGKIRCLCSACASDCSDENMMKIVKVKFGYVSVVTKLKTVDCVRHILVCEPNYLVAFGKSGRLHVWVMNSTWSAKREEFIVQPDDCMYSPSIVDLKRIPNCAHLVVGFNGFGEFSIWDISKRILLSRFCTPRTSICEFFPVSLFSWQREDLNFSSSMDAYVEEVMAATSMWFSEPTKNHSLLSLDGENMAVWLLVRVVSDSDAQHDHISGHFERNSVGLWRLALLVKNMVILGSALDPRAAAIGTSGSQGIIGTFDGMVYSWEMTTGSKLGTMHHFKGGSVSCISTDDSRSAAVAVASTEGQLLVYQHS